MADEVRSRGERPSELEAIELDGAPGDLEQAMREAVAAVEEVEAEARADKDGADPAPSQPAEELARLRREIADLRDRSLRTLADFDNFRKRSDRERQELRRYALLEPLRELLPVMDNLERALSAEGSAEDLKRGVGMTLRQMQDALRRQGVREVAAAGEPFDPAVHEAVAREMAAAPGSAGGLGKEGIKVPTVTAELMRGYYLHDRLLRPAMVRVAMPAEPPRAETSAGGSAPAGEGAPPGESTPAPAGGSPDRGEGD